MPDLFECPDCFTGLSAAVTDHAALVFAASVAFALALSWLLYRLFPED